MRKSIFILLLLFSFTINIFLCFADDLTTINITVISQNNSPVNDAVVQIGDLSAKTDSSGKAVFSVFPAAYDVSISKLNYITTKSSIEVLGSSTAFAFTLTSNFIPVSIKAIDSLTGFPVITSIKATNASTNVSSFSSSNESGEVVLELAKNSIYSLEVEEKHYNIFTRNLDTSKLMSSNFIFKLERLDSEASFTFNTTEGNVSFRTLPSDTFFKEYDFKGRLLSINIPFGKYEVAVTCKGYKTMTKILNIDSKIFSETFSLVPNNKPFSFFVTAGDDSGMNFYSDLRPSSYPVVMKNTTINLFINNTLEKTIIFDGKESKVNIPYGVYDIEVKNDLADSFTIENVDFSESTPNNVVFSMKQMFASVKGLIKLGTYFMGGVNIIFTDSAGNEYSTLSDIDGSYNIKIPSRTYKVNATKDGYTIRDNTPISLSASLPNETYQCDIDIEEIRSIINGRIKSLDGSPVPNARITLKLDKEETVTYSNDDGKYSVSVNSGLIFIKIDKPGFKSKGTVKTVNKFSTITGLDFTLEEIYASLDGVITDGIIPLENISIRLLDANKQLVSKILSRQNGSFIFDNVKSISEYYISIDDEKFYPYTSNLIKIEYNSVKNYNITLQKNSLSVIIDVKDKLNNPMTGCEFIIDGVVHKTDITGFIELEYHLRDLPKTISIIAEKYNYKEDFKIDALMSSPIKKEIILRIEK